MGFDAGSTLLIIVLKLGVSEFQHSHTLDRILLWSILEFNMHLDPYVYPCVSVRAIKDLILSRRPDTLKLKTTVHYNKTFYTFTRNLLHIIPMLIVEAIHKGKDFGVITHIHKQSVERHTTWDQNGDRCCDSCLTFRDT